MRLYFYFSLLRMSRVRMPYVFDHVSIQRTNEELRLHKREGADSLALELYRTYLSSDSNVLGWGKMKYRRAQGRAYICKDLQAALRLACNTYGGGLGPQVPHRQGSESGPRTITGWFCRQSVASRLPGSSLSPPVHSASRPWRLLGFNLTMATE